MTPKNFNKNGKVYKNTVMYSKTFGGDENHNLPLDEWMKRIKRGDNPARNKAFEELLLDLPGIKNPIDKIDDLKIEVDEIKKLPPGTVINRTTLVSGSNNEEVQEALKAVTNLRNEVSELKEGMIDLRGYCQRIRDYRININQTQGIQKGDHVKAESSVDLLTPYSDSHIKKLEEIAKRIEALESNLKKFTEDSSQRIKELENSQAGFVGEVASVIQEKLDTAALENQLTKIIDERVNGLHQEFANISTKENLDFIVESLSELEEKFKVFQEENKNIMSKLPESIREAVREEMKKKATALVEKMFS